MSTVETPRPGLRLRRNEPWVNFPQNLRGTVERYYDVWNHEGAVPADWRVGLGNLLYVVGEAATNQRRVRAGGATWSMSPVALTPEYFVNVRPLNVVWSPMKGADLAPGRPDDTYVHAQAGLQVIDLHRVLLAFGRSLPTAGANAGQAIWGALCTCTHGSGLTRGPIAEYVRAAMVVVDGNKPVWVERKSLPVASDAYVKGMGLDPAKDVLRDDDVLDALMVSFGAMGLVHSVVIETDPVFTLEFYRQRVDYDGALRSAVHTLDFQGLELPGGKERPYHFEVVINPYALGAGKRGASVTTCYRRPYTPTPTQPGGGAAVGVGPDLSSVVAGLASVAPPMVPVAMGPLLESGYPEMHRTGTLGELFGNPGPDYRTFSTEIAVPLAQAADAVDVIVHEVQASRPGYYYPGLVALRFVQPSRGHLAFTRFSPMTCTIELPALGGVAGTQQFYARVWAALAQKGIPFALHWGQINNADPAAVKQAFGDGVTKWRTARAKLLKNVLAQRMFSSAFTDACGLTP